MSLFSKAVAEIIENVAGREAVERAAGRAGARAVERAAGEGAGSKVGEMIAAASPPPAIRARAGTPQANAQDILTEAGRKAKARDSYAEWRKRNPGAGQLLDMHRLAEVPPVPQQPMPRYVPPRGPSARMKDALSSRRVQRGIRDAVERGAEGGGLEWYNTEPLRERMAYAAPGDSSAYPRLMDIMAATSPRSAVPDNIRTASYYNYLLANDLPIPDKPAPGYGSIAQEDHLRHVRGVADLGGWDVFRNPKPASFSGDLQGNQINVAVDTHNMRLPGILSQDPRFLAGSTKGDKGAPALNPAKMYKDGEITINEALTRPAFWESKPRDNEYGYYENWQRERARKMGMSPAQYQASMWLGAGDITGLASPPEPFLHTFESRVRYTADRMGLSPDTVLEQVLAGKVPLLAEGGHVALNKLKAKYG